MKPPCDRCGHIHATTDAYAVGRFRPDGPVGYRTNYYGAPLRLTRAEAEADACTRRIEADHG